MSAVKENQDKVIELIKDAMSAREGEEFFIQKINMYHPWHQVLTDNYYTGSLFIVGNKSYMDMLEEEQKKSLYLYPEDKNPDVLRFQGRAKSFDVESKDKKAVIIKYRDSKEKYDFKKVINSSTVGEKYPYLEGILSNLKNVTEDSNYVDELINEVNKEIENSSSQSLDKGHKKL